MRSKQQFQIQSGLAQAVSVCDGACTVAEDSAQLRRSARAGAWQGTDTAAGVGQDGVVGAQPLAAAPLPQ